MDSSTPQDEKKEEGRPLVSGPFLDIYNAMSTVRLCRVLQQGNLFNLNSLLPKPLPSGKLFLEGI